MIGQICHQVDQCSNSVCVGCEHSGFTELYGCDIKGRDTSFSIIQNNLKARSSLLYKRLVSTIVLINVAILLIAKQSHFSLPLTQAQYRILRFLAF